LRDEKFHGVWLKGTRRPYGDGTDSSCGDLKQVGNQKVGRYRACSGIAVSQEGRGDAKEKSKKKWLWANEKHRTDTQVRTRKDEGGDGQNVGCLREDGINAVLG